MASQRSCSGTMAPASFIPSASSIRSSLPRKSGKGTGLGLSICYGIIREHQGEISCRNNTDGPGATFLVRLPLAAEGIVHAAEANA